MLQKITVTANVDIYSNNKDFILSPAWVKKTPLFLSQFQQFRFYYIIQDTGKIKANPLQMFEINHGMEPCTVWFSCPNISPLSISLHVFLFFQYLPLWKAGFEMSFCFHSIEYKVIFVTGHLALSGSLIILSSL